MSECAPIKLIYLFYHRHVDFIANLSLYSSPSGQRGEKVSRWNKVLQRETDQRKRGRFTQKVPSKIKANLADRTSKKSSGWARSISFNRSLNVFICWMYAYGIEMKNLKEHKFENKNKNWA